MHIQLQDMLVKGISACPFVITLLSTSTLEECEGI